MTRVAYLKISTMCMVGGILAAGGIAKAAELSDQQKLIEQMKIEELLTRSTRAFDSHDVDAWIATFTPDGEWDTQYVTCKGPEALRAYLTKGFNCIGVPGGAAVPGAQPPPFSGRSSANAATPSGNRSSGGAEHFASWPLYEFINDHTVHYTAYWMTVSGGSENVGGRIMSVGHYDDTLVKLNGKWLIKKRQLKH